jgi:hypothetical protein
MPRDIWEWLLDEKIVLGALAVIFASMALLVIHWNADKEYVAFFTSVASGCIGALTRGIINK